MMGKLKRVGNFFQGKYVAEDDTFKIANFVVEQEKLRRAYTKAGIEFTEESIEQQAANIVKNTVPNYAFVGSAVRTARLLPIGNFMSFPALKKLRKCVGIDKTVFANCDIPFGNNKRFL